MLFYLLLGLLGMLATGLALAVFASPTRFRREQRRDSSTRLSQSVQVLVLGDIGRSPRMQYHALSIAQHGGLVQLIGYLDSDLLPGLVEHPLVTVVPISGPPGFLQTNHKLLFALFGPLKVLFQIWSLWNALAYRTQPSKWLLVQNPPSIPTLAVASLACSLRSTKLIIDWHNFGYSILALKLGSDHPFVRLSLWYEQAFGQTASAHLAVTNAMGRVLKQQFGIRRQILTLHDRPAPQFQPLTSIQKRSFLTCHPLLQDRSDELVQNKTRLLVSSTSWTPDEDFSLLLDALCIYSEKSTTTHPQLPEILTVITGKGPQKDYYVGRIQRLKEQDKLEMVTIKTEWLSFADYASLLGAADLGVSLHTSSSGVDFPMKVVDMFGAGLPVAGWSDFEAWPELVKEGVNGRGFNTATKLADILIELFDPADKDIHRLKKGAISEGKRRWNEEWDSVAGPLLGIAR